MGDGQTVPELFMKINLANKLFTNPLKNENFPLFFLHIGTSQLYVT